MNEWIEIKNRLPDNQVLVQTKVADPRGDHSIIPLARHKHLWYNPITFQYIYYTPTHWRSLSKS